MRMGKETLWAAVVEKDSDFDGRFVYAVESTGIYCRPSCPSRKPKKENVQYYLIPEAAERDGFRACLRCRPNDEPLKSKTARKVEHACRLIRERIDDLPSLEELSSTVGMSRFHFQRTFKQFMGITPKQYGDAIRLDAFKRELRKEGSVTDAIYEAGYGSGSRVYEKSDARLGMTPATYGKGGEGAAIQYAVADSPLGNLLVARTPRGICSVRFGDTVDELRSGLRTEFPKAEIVESAWEAWFISAVLKHLEGKQPDLDLPLDVRATAFQWLVWTELKNIPYGEVRTYKQIAEKIGRPRAARAVARACAANPVAVAIPCHRVVRGDGETGGYRWGSERKKKLLATEKKRS